MAALLYFSIGNCAPQQAVGYDLFSRAVAELVRSMHGAPPGDDEEARTALARLSPLAASCEGCRFNRHRAAFSCFDGFGFPLEVATEEWLLDLMTESPYLPFIPGALAALGVSGAIARRQRGHLLEGAQGGSVRRAAGVDGGEGHYRLWGFFPPVTLLGAPLSSDAVTEALFFADEWTTELPAAVIGALGLTSAPLDSTFEEVLATLTLAPLDTAHTPQQRQLADYLRARLSGPLRTRRLELELR